MSVLSDIRTVLQELRRGRADWRQRAVLANYGGTISIGTIAAGIQGGGAGTVIDPEQPEGLIAVQSGYTLVPLRVTVSCQVPLLAADSDRCDILLAYDRTTLWPGTGTFTAQPIIPMNSHAGTTPSLNGVVAASAFTADTITPVLVEIDRSNITGDVQGTPASALWTPLALLHEPATCRFINGPATLFIYWGGTVAVTGYAQADFLSIPTRLLPDFL